MDPLPPVLPTPDFVDNDLRGQIDALRAELRDGRILQAQQRNDLKTQSARLLALTARVRNDKREILDLTAKLNNERGEVGAVRKRLKVAVKNHAEAQDKCARTMVECERLRMVNAHLASLSEDFDHKLRQAEEGFDMKLQEAKLTFSRNAEKSKRDESDQWSSRAQALQKELDTRDAKIKKLERDLSRQCEINAMFTIDYDRDTSFTKQLRVPLPFSNPSDSEFPLSQERGLNAIARRPLMDLEDNQASQPMKRLRTGVENAGKVKSPLKTRQTPRNGFLVKQAQVRSPTFSRSGLFDVL